MPLATMPDEERILGDLARFRGSCKIELTAAHLAEKMTRPFLNGLVRAVPGGLDSRLTLLDLTHCTGPRRVAELASVLHMCSSLTHLNLSENMFGMRARGLFGWNNASGEDGGRGDGGNMARLSKACQGCTALVRLELSSNEIGREGIASLAPTLTQLTCLQHLHLASNHISGSGAPVLRRFCRNARRCRLSTWYLRRYHANCSAYILRVHQVLTVCVAS
eukprot:2875411-Rhodomonas_salina.1